MLGKRLYLAHNSLPWTLFCAFNSSQCVQLRRIKMEKEPQHRRDCSENKTKDIQKLSLKENSDFSFINRQQWLLTYLLIWAKKKKGGWEDGRRPRISGPDVIQRWTPQVTWPSRGVDVTVAIYGCVAQLRKWLFKLSLPTFLFLGTQNITVLTFLWLELPSEDLTQII